MTRISDAVIADHRELDHQFNKIVHANHMEEQSRHQNQFVWELARHFAAEELVLYPAMEKHLGTQGKALADKDRRESQVVKDHLKTFQSMKPSDCEYIHELRTLMDNLGKHILEEEKEDLVLIERALSTEDSEGLAKSFERTKMFAPTRAHPRAPNKPPFETAVGLMMAPIDRLKDAFHRFP